jgi:plasmid stability protein
MPTTLTLKNIPDALYERLRASADLHRRSLNGEILICLESVLLPGRISVKERIARAKALRDEFGNKRFKTREIDAAKRTGRS